jgi:hypothetical protein
MDREVSLLLATAIKSLEQLLAAYTNSIAPEHRASFSAKLMFYGNRLLHINPDNLMALAIVVHENEAMAKIMNNPREAIRLRTEAADLAERGLKVAGNTHRPADMSEEDYAKFISNVTTAFNRALSAAGRRNQ